MNLHNKQQQKKAKGKRLINHFKMDFFFYLPDDTYKTNNYKNIKKIKLADLITVNYFTNCSLNQKKV